MNQVLAKGKQFLFVIRQSYVNSIYTIELELTNTTYTASNFDTPSERKWMFRLNPYDKDMIFPIVNFPFICSNFATTPVYGVFIS